jgi:trk system potassium uptake protein TrkA
MLVIIVGGGKTGSQLAVQLLNAGHEVRVIEQRSAVLERLRHELPEQVIFTGDGSAPTVLEQAGITRAQALAAVTGADEVNLVITTLGRFEFNVPLIIARVNNPLNAWLFTPEMGVDMAINQADLMARLIAEEISLGDMVTLLKLQRGQYSLVEQKVPAGARAIGVPLKDLGLPDQCVIAAIMREDKMVLPRGVTAIQAGDEVLALADEEGAEQLAALFAAPGTD